MAYAPKHNFRRKDSLNPGDPDKIIYGADLQDEFDAIAENLNLLSQIDIDGDGNINIPPELIEGLVDALGDKADQVDLEAEIAARIAGDEALQKQIDALGGGGGGGGAGTWDELTGKPTEFPPEAHTQGWDTITDKPATYPPEEHTHEQSEVDGLEDRLTAIEGSISSGGGFVDAPNDGKLYGRQSEAWAEVVIPDAADPDWADIQNKPAEYPPESHDHEEITKDAAYIKYVVDKWEASPSMSVTGDLAVGGETSLNGNLSVDGGIDATGSISLGGDLAIGGKIEGDLTINGNITIGGGGSISNPSGDEYLTDAPGDGSQYARQDGAWAVVEGGGSGLIDVLDSPPSDAEEGQQWFSSTDGYMYMRYGTEWVAIGGTA